MQAAKPLDKNIQFLITANYQRMVSFEQAAFLTNEPSFKEFYLQKAEESEINMQQLYLMLNTKPGDGLYGLPNMQPGTFLPGILNSKKNTIRILESIKKIEKTVAGWYKTTLREIAGLPHEMVNLVEEQYRLLANTQLQLERL